MGYFHFRREWSNNCACEAFFNEQSGHLFWSYSVGIAHGAVCNAKKKVILLCVFYPYLDKTVFNVFLINQFEGKSIGRYGC